MYQQILNDRVRPRYKWPDFVDMEERSLQWKLHSESLKVECRYIDWP